MAGASGKILLIPDDSYWPALEPLLEQAKKSIDLLEFSFAIGSAAGRLDQKGLPYKVAEKLCALKRKRKSLKIRLYIEGYRETADRNAVTAKMLEANGVEVRFGQTHAKGICVD